MASITTKTDTKVGSGFGRNQQISVASIFALMSAAMAIAMGYFPLTNTYSLLFGGLAVLLSARATLYAWTGTVYTRAFPPIALSLSILAMTFCFAWPWYCAGALDDYLPAMARQAEKPATVPENTQPINTPPVITQVAPVDAVPDAQRKDDLETFRQIKEQAEKEKAQKRLNEAVKPPRPPE